MVVLASVLTGVIMANRPFVSLATRIASDAPGAPQPVLVQHIRWAAIDTCERALAWRHRADPMVITAGQGEYEYEAPEDSEVHAIIAASIGKPGENNFSPLTAVSSETFFGTYPGWPDHCTDGMPRVITHINADTFGIGPIPDDDYELRMLVALKPLRTATGMDETAFDEIETTISHGALHHLLVQQQKPWTNDSLSLYHGRQYSFLLNERRARHNLGTPRAMLVVNVSGYPV